MNSYSQSRADQVKKKVGVALDLWPDPEARRRLLSLCTGDDLDHLNAVGYALARCGQARREAAEEFLAAHERDRRLALRTVVLYARAFRLDAHPRAFVKEMARVAALPGVKPWVPIMEELYWMWSRAPREMFRLMTPWLTHRDPWRRWAALHGLEVPARKDPRGALKVLRLFRGERHLRVRRLLGHVFGQNLYPHHPRDALEEMARWLCDGAPAAGPVSRQTEKQVAWWRGAELGSERQRRRLLGASRFYEDHHDPDVRAHARRLVRVLET